MQLGRVADTVRAMRNPIRRKNLSLRFVPYYLVGGVLVFFTRVEWPGFALGLLPICAGLALRSWGAGHLVKTDRLTVTGPYAHVRHPLYLGTILVAIGFALIMGAWPAFLILCGVLPWFFFSYFPRKEQSEGKRLSAIYGRAYELYREGVPALWPRLAPWSPGSDDHALFPAGAGWSGDCYDDNNELGTLLGCLAGAVLLALRATAG